MRARSGAPAGQSGLLSARAVYAFVGLLVLAAGGVLLNFHLFDEPWHDEVYTLRFFATDLASAFGDYHVPNNHVLYSAFVALFRDLVPEDADLVLWLRVAGMVFFVTATGLTMLAVRRLAGPGAGLLAGTLFVTSHVATNFGEQIRGYALSWVFVAGAFWAVTRSGLWRQSGEEPATHPASRPAWGFVALYGLCAALAVGTIPTNLMIVWVIAAWAVTLLWTQKSSFSRRTRAVATAAFVALPLAGLAFYAGVAEALLMHARHYKAGWTYGATVSHFVGATLGDVWWIVPVWGAGLLLFSARLSVATHDPASPRVRLWLCLWMIPGLGLAWALLPNPAYPRNLVPALPLWFAAFATGLYVFVDRVFADHPRAGRMTVLVLVAVFFVLAFYREPDRAGYAPRHDSGDRPQNLYDQYYHGAFHPSRAVGWVARFSANLPTVVFIDASDEWALDHAVENLQDPDRFPPVILINRRPLDSRRVAAAASDRLPVFITRNQEAARAMLDRLSKAVPSLIPAGVALEELHGTGFFKVYAPKQPER